MKIKIIRNFPTGSADIYFYRDSDNGKRSYVTIQEIKEYGMSFQETTVNEGDSIKPFLSIPNFLVKIFFKSMLEELTSQGIETDEVIADKAKLQATLVHLDDIKNIVNRLFEANSSLMNILKERNDSPQVIPLANPIKLKFFDDVDMMNFAVYYHNLRTAGTDKTAKQLLEEWRKND